MSYHTWDNLTLNGRPETSCKGPTFTHQILAFIPVSIPKMSHLIGATTTWPLSIHILRITFSERRRKKNIISYFLNFPCNRREPYLGLSSASTCSSHGLSRFSFPKGLYEPSPPLLPAPTPSLSRQLAPHQWQHRGSSLAENAQLYQLIFLSKTNYPSCMVRLTEPALTPGRSGYWCDLVLAPRSAFLSSLLLSSFPSTLIQHSPTLPSQWSRSMIFADPLCVFKSC